MTTRNLKIGAVALAMSGMFAASTAMANNAEALNNSVSMAQLSQKMQSQNTAGTQFIIKYKDNSNQLMSVSGADMSPAMMNSRAQSFVKNFKSKKKSSLQTKYVRKMALSNHHVMRVDKKLTPAEAQSLMQEMAETGNIEYIEVDQMLQPFATPNDPRYSDQWHYFEAAGGINAPAAWDKATGDGVVVAVLDTGYRPHADLSANILPGYDMISDISVANDGGGRDSDARDPGDAVSANECGYTHSARDSSWHGTHVAGTVAAVSNNGEGVAGVAYDAKVVPVRVLGKCGGLTSDIADAIVWASGGSVSGVPSNANPADVINMSLGGSGACSSTTQNAINTARANGTTIVIAAGNDNDNSANYNPGNCSGIINVASVGRNGGRAYYSNYGSNIDVAAPGGAQSFANDPEGILSTYNAGSNTPSSDSYAYSQGTSMAAPHVAGVAALIKQAKPTATPDEVESILKNTTRSFPATCTSCGTGIIDASAAVDAALNGTGGNELEDGVAKTSLSGSKGSQTFYTFDVGSGVSQVTFTMSGGTGDADLYVRANAKPTTSVWDCRPYEGGNNEVCTIDNPASGTYHVMMNGYSAYSGVSLKAETAGGSTGPVELNESNLSASTGGWVQKSLEVPAGMSNLTVTISGGTGDADLFVKQGSVPSSSNWDCRPYKGGNSETCTFTNPQAGTWYFGLNAYRSFSGVTLSAQAQ
ncbi:S8 family peptidase [Pseudoalteromonas viridis]|uniref:S8 family serine peptidase n=1 Tax=Pseudoalteromonas viridis TaxID=339617 RepID=A0ABX7V4X3_9GAMM|nr:S8 family peptidase [Pseudoalteromonas viridis]QTL35939.1 S8 family serine peptidase [Pseudoalteromonas viridis]